MAEGERRASESPIVVARKLRKAFGSFVAVNDVDFSIARGEVFGFLGPNGAGKTSTMRMIACISPISDGYLSVLGMDPSSQGSAIRAGIGVIPQEDALDEELTVADNLYIYGRYFGLPRRVIRERLEALLEFARLTDRAESKVESLSGGMRRRLTIARALISSPELVILDEPTTGLDPQARRLVWDRLRSLKRAGVTLVVTTHYMDEAEQLCDRLVVMDGGKIVAAGSPRELVDRFVRREVLELRLRDDAEDSDYKSLADAVSTSGAAVELYSDRLCCYSDDGDELLDAVVALGYQPASSLVRRASLEDVFLRLTGHSLVD